MGTCYNEGVPFSGMFYKGLCDLGSILKLAEGPSFTCCNTRSILHLQHPAVILTRSPAIFPPQPACTLESPLTRALSRHKRGYLYKALLTKSLDPETKTEDT